MTEGFAHQLNEHRGKTAPPRQMVKFNDRRMCTFSIAVMHIKKTRRIKDRLHLVTSDNWLAVTRGRPSYRAVTLCSWFYTTQTRRELNSTFLSLSKKKSRSCCDGAPVFHRAFARLIAALCVLSWLTNRISRTLWRRK